MREEIDKRRLVLEQAHLELEWKSRQADVEAELTMLRRRYERTKRAVDTGLASRTALAEIETQIARTEQQFAAAKREQELRAAEFEIRRIEIEHQRDLERRQLELEMARRDIAKQAEGLALYERAAGDQLRTEADARAVYERWRDLSASGIPQELIWKALAQQTEPVPASQPIDGNMILTIEIGGEPDLPRDYAVHSENGTIRLPLLGSIRVVGRTAAQVQEDIRKLLVDRRLGEKPTVEVTARRRVKQ
jgi:hypothetical protein